jgi:hypothetical protein
VVIDFERALGESLNRGCIVVVGARNNEYDTLSRKRNEINDEVNG